MYHLAPIGLSWGMKMQTELEQTQLEIAKLQLEQERRKLAGLQKRQRVADNLGAGATAVGGAAKGGLRWLFFVLLGALGGGVFGWLAAAAVAVVTSQRVCRTYPDADLMYRVGCALGERADMLLLFAAISAAYGVYAGHKLHRER